MWPFRGLICFIPLNTSYKNKRKNKTKKKQKNKKKQKQKKKTIERSNKRTK